MKLSEDLCECSKIDKILKNHSYEESALISILHEIENLYDYLPTWTLRHTSKKLNIPMIQIYGVASFYDAFHLKPRGKHLIRVCKGTACYLKGATQIVEALERELEIKEGETTRDKKFSLQAVHCVGACALAPVIVIDEHYFDKTSPTKLRSMLKKVQKSNEKD
ncbi:MAG TPA: NAD(P)H-dependent oxidoreductase subunit E [Candidatus Thermoplasmatota archaeon]|nr:NAD(P)H-dependent oxidoreductase subunit E [Candidatus Thermoplasmatota archaeon]